MKNPADQILPTVFAATLPPHFFQKGSGPRC